MMSPFKDSCFTTVKDQRTNSYEFEIRYLHAKIMLKRNAKNSLTNLK